MKKKPQPDWPMGKLFPTYLIKEQGEWFYLFHALLLLLLLYPYLMHVTGGPPFLLILLGNAVIVTVIYSLSFNWRQLALAGVLGLPALVLPWLSDTRLLATLYLSSTSLLYLYAILMILPYIFYSTDVDSEEIYGVVSIYILIGLVWSGFYHILDIWVPGSFEGVLGRATHTVSRRIDFIYFSFTTLTTLGYGDISPASQPARSLAIIEAITGVICMGVMMARVLGLYVAGLMTEKKQDVERT